MGFPVDGKQLLLVIVVMKADKVIITAIAIRHPEIRLIHKPVNEGKGAAIRTALQHCRGAIVAIQDADLEYDPQDLLTLMEPLLIAFLGVTIGSIVIAMYLPLFTLIGKLSQGH